MVSKKDEAPQDQPGKKPRHRSPNYPAEGLEAAVRRIRKLYEADREAGSTVESAVKHIGFSKAHGEALSVLAGLKKFGLVETNGNRVTVTKRAINILLFPDQERGKRALQEAALLPQIYRDLFNRAQKSGLPSDQTLRSELIADKGFNPRVVDAFLKDFRGSLAYAGISPESMVSSTLELPGEEEESELKAKIETKQPLPRNDSQQSAKSKVLNVPLDPLSSEAPQFAQVLVPLPLREDQKKRLLSFIESL